ncbi:MAG: putative quorum-quenching lactonase YtnP [Ignavibacteriaceae bacterium]|nr:putative quorum-quenching lactonase YtnP [Ignavibacteriaceae bacterium]
MKIGKYKLGIINSGSFGLDGGAMFGIIPKPLWQKTNPADDVNRVRLATRNLLLESDSKKIIIDTGMGSKWDEKSKNIYAIDEMLSMNSALESKGLKAEDITDVFLTHLHFDHTGGSTFSVNAKYQPAFPNAKYYVQKQNYEWAINPSDRDRGSYIKENFQPLMDEGLLKFTNGNSMFDDEIEFLVINGHTFGQQMIKISDGINTILFCSDLMPFISHISLPYIMGYDLQPLVTLEEKLKYLKLALDENWKLFFGHDPDFAVATVKKLNERYAVDKSFRTFDET